MRNTLYIVVPAFNEEECLEACAQALVKKLEDLQQKNLCSVHGGGGGTHHTRGTCTDHNCTHV